MKHASEAEVAALLSTVERQGHAMIRVELVESLTHNVFNQLYDVHQHLARLLQLAESITRDKPRSELVESVERISSFCEWMASTLREIREPSQQRLDAGETFQLLEAARTVARQFSSYLESGHVKLTLEVPDTIVVRGSASAFQLVLSSLLVNSIQAHREAFCRAALSIRITARMTCDEGENAVRVQYSDNGPGIDPAAFPDPQRIFDLGASSTERAGLGLAVSRLLIERHFSGSLSLESAVPAVFRLNIPLNQRPSAL